jgi:hypothetical protein
MRIGDTLDQVQSAEGNVDVALSSVLPSDAAAKAISAYRSIPEGAVGAVAKMATGHVDAATVAPLIAAALLASGVGAPIAGIVAAAIPLVAGVVQAIQQAGWASFIFGPPAPHCDWTYGDASQRCVSGKRPWGPGDSAHWSPFTDYIGQAFAHYDELHALAAALAGDTQSDYQAATPYGAGASGYYDLRQRYADEARGWPQGLRDFYAAYILAWKADAERQANGMQGAVKSQLLQTVVDAHNRAHAAPTMQLAGKSFADGGTFVEAMLNGDVDDQVYPPITINVGPASVPPEAHMHLRARGASPPLSGHTLHLHHPALAGEPMGGAEVAVVYPYVYQGGAWSPTSASWGDLGLVYAAIHAHPGAPVGYYAWDGQAMTWRMAT